MTSVTITVDGPRGRESVTIERDGPLVLPPLFAAVHATIEAHPGEVALVTATMKALGDMVAAAGLKPEERVRA